MVPLACFCCYGLGFVIWVFGLCFSSLGFGILYVNAALQDSTPVWYYCSRPSLFLLSGMFAGAVFHFSFSLSLSFSGAGPSGFGFPVVFLHLGHALRPRPVLLHLHLHQGHRPAPVFVLTNSVVFPVVVWSLSVWGLLGLWVVLCVLFAFFLLLCLVACVGQMHSSR